MRKLFLFSAMAIAFASCATKQAKEYDSNKVTLSNTATIQPHDRYYQSVNVPTRGIKALVDISNQSDTAKVFIVEIKEK